MEQAKTMAKELMAFIADSPSCYHVTDNFGKLLEQAGYTCLQLQQRRAVTHFALPRIYHIDRIRNRS